MEEEICKFNTWDWTNVTSDSWLQISAEFLPIALQWKEKFQSVLDIGAGKGRHSFFFAENGLNVSAIDLAESSIKMLEQKAAETNIMIDAKVADMTDLPFNDNSFDGVICFHTIYHTDYAGMQKVLREIKRVLRVGGEAYITFNSKDNVKYNKEKTLDGFTIIPTDGKEAGIPHCYVNEQDIEKLLEDFIIISLNKEQNYVWKERPVTGIHYFVHVRLK